MAIPMSRANAGSTKYFDRDGKVITRAKWESLIVEPSYWTVRQFDNGRVLIRIVWKGIVPDADNQFRSSYELFKLELFNYSDAGAAIIDPNNGRSFPTEKKALEFYNDFILKWTESSLDEEGNIEEVGNTLKPIEPPKPPDPNKPTSAVEELELDANLDMSAGAW